MIKKIWTSMLVVFVFLSAMHMGEVGVSALELPTITLETNLESQKTSKDTLTFNFTVVTTDEIHVIEGDVIKLELPTNLVDMGTVKYNTKDADELFEYAFNPTTGVVTLTAKTNITRASTKVLAISAMPQNVTGTEDIMATYIPVRGTGQEITTNKTLSVIALVDKTTVIAQDVKVYIGQTWTDGWGLVSATDKDGKRLTVGDVEVGGDKVVANKEGVYHVTYSYDNASGEPVVATSVVTVLVDQTEIILRDVKVTRGNEWNPEDSFVSAKDKDGNPILYTAFTNFAAGKEDRDENWTLHRSFSSYSLTATAELTHNVDVTRTGMYQITFRYEDHYTGFVKIETATINVYVPTTEPAPVMPTINVNIPVTTPNAPNTPNTGVTGSMLPWLGVMVVAAGTGILLQKKKEEE